MELVLGLGYEPGRPIEGIVSYEVDISRVHCLPRGGSSGHTGSGSFKSFRQLVEASIAGSRFDEPARASEGSGQRNGVGSVVRTGRAGQAEGRPTKRKEPKRKEPAVGQLPKLGNENYKEWAVSLFLYLERSDYWDIVDGERKKPEKKTGEKTQQQHILNSRNAKEFWNTLKAVHSTPNKQRLGTLLIQTRSRNSLDRRFFEFNTIVARPREEETKRGNVTSKENTLNAQKDKKKKKKKKDKSKITCYDYQKKGHYSSDCWEPGGGKEGTGPANAGGGVKPNPQRGASNGQGYGEGSRGRGGGQRQGNRLPTKSKARFGKTHSKEPGWRFIP
ncbi:MAG: hypothetical protein M1816_007032 [Peltula sp. TS41687]|nr:MAG: hypothetical protein M1816_007032 [Peltula sp. TS41687]